MLIEVYKIEGHRGYISTEFSIFSGTHTLRIEQNQEKFPFFEWNDPEHFSIYRNPEINPVFIFSNRKKSSLQSVNRKNFRVPFRKREIFQFPFRKSKTVFLQNSIRHLGSYLSSVYSAQCTSNLSVHMNNCTNLQLAVQTKFPNYNTRPEIVIVTGKN